MSETPSNDTHLAGEERRGADCWNSADIHRAAEQRAGASDGHPDDVDNSQPGRVGQHDDEHNSSQRTTKHMLRGILTPPLVSLLTA